MRINPFSLDDVPCWLATQKKVSVIRSHLLKAARNDPSLSQWLPTLRGKDALAAVTAFFSSVTDPLAKTIDALYTSPHLRSPEMVTEILSCMACEVGKMPLPSEVVLGVCATLTRQSVWCDPEEECLFQLQEATWQLSWHQSTIPIHCGAETLRPVVVLVAEEESGKVLAFRCVPSLPTSEELGVTLYDALVYPQLGQIPLLTHLRPPTCLSVQGSLSAEIAQAAREWNIDVTLGEHTECAFLRQWEAELTGRVLDPVHYLRIFDCACERAFGYAPFLQKQRLARWLGWHGRQEYDPAWCFAGLRSLFPKSVAHVAEDGTIEWRGWHYRDTKDDILRYWAHETVMVQPSPSTEALIWVYCNDALLCDATADELRKSSGDYRPYWFPYSRLGE